jgi:hypothetical protein
MACMKENNEKKMENCDEISKLIKAFPWDKDPKVGEDNEWKDVQKKDTNNRPSETRKRRKTRKKIINKTSYFLSNSLNKSLNHEWRLKISPKKRRRKIRKLFYEKWIPFQQ